jgi:hypothetical protein
VTVTEDVVSGSAAVHFRFNGWSGRPLSVLPVTAGDALPPEAVQATDAAGAAQIDALVARRRAELARLALAERTALQRCDRAEVALNAMADTGVDGIPADLLAVVDAMLEKAVGASELALASVEQEASFIVDSAMADGVEVVRRAGIDPAVVALVPRPVAAARSVARPPTAAELWRSTRHSVARSPMARTPDPSPTGPVGPQRTAAPSAPVAPGPVASVPHVPHPVSIAVAVPSLPPVADAAVDLDAVTAVAAPAVATLLLDEPITGPGHDDPAEVYDMFWQEVPGERRVRDRLRRRSPKEGA